MAYPINSTTSSYLQKQIYLLIWYLLIKMWMWKSSHAPAKKEGERNFSFLITLGLSPFLLANSPLSVPALEEDLLRVGVEETDYPEVGDHLGPGYVQLLRSFVNI